mmetsp:Transcript_74009/g.205078  ORF Transcript_74009/g.205078 Transcript_74009/m.205078 type:complete len:264 (+) Transcript_74009:329-1120(+)
MASKMRIAPSSAWKSFAARASSSAFVASSSAFDSFFGSKMCTCATMTAARASCTWSPNSLKSCSARLAAFKASLNRALRSRACDRNTSETPSWYLSADIVDKPMACLAFFDASRPLRRMLSLCCLLPPPFCSKDSASFAPFSKLTRASMFSKPTSPVRSSERRYNALACNAKRMAASGASFASSAMAWRCNAAAWPRLFPRSRHRTSASTAAFTESGYSLPACCISETTSSALAAPRRSPISSKIMRASCAFVMAVAKSSCRT